MRLRQSGGFSIFSSQVSFVAVVVLLLNAGADGFVVSVPGKVTQESMRLTRPDASLVLYTHNSKCPVVRGGHGYSETSRRSTKARMSAEETSLGFGEKVVTAWNTVIPVGDPDEMPPCPSGISSLPKPLQAATALAVFAGIGAGTVAFLNGFSALEAFLPEGWFSIWQSTWSPPLGLIFAAAGVAHFTELEGFSNIYPGRGAWGLWYLPGTASFHVKWTGVAEVAGGLGLVLGWLGLGPAGLQAAAALGLFALTIAVTPANIYMYTHGAQFPVGLEVPVVGHLIRGVLQCVLLAFFWTLAQ